MRKIYLYVGVLSCLLLGCHGEATKGNNHNNNNNNNDNINGEVLIENGSELTLYYDIPQTIKIDLKEGNANLKVEKNNCINILTDQIVADKDGIATLKIQPKLFNCENGKKVKVCVDKFIETPQGNDNCIEFTVRTTSNDDEIDANHNLMIDLYETNKDKDKFADYQPNDCSSYCHDDGDCEDFCDSAIGFRCSTRCTRDEQCIKYQDDDDNWIQMVCRKDGRCAYPSFKAVYKIKNDETKITMGGQPAEENVTIDWGDGTKETIPTTTNSDLSHTYAKKGQYEVEITGDYRNWTAGCSKNVELYDVLQFGSIGLGFTKDLNLEGQSGGSGSFMNCSDWNRLTAEDIPDSTKLTNMTRMFASYNGGNTEGMIFNEPHPTRWDTSNVESMVGTFRNAGRDNGYTHGLHGQGFNQNIGRWNTSKVTSMESMFFDAVIFNQPIGCWDMSNVEDISYMFTYTETFNQNLVTWDLSKVTKHECVFRYENGHNGDISLKNYCMLRSRVNNENIGRDGDRTDKVNGDCPDIIKNIDHINDVPVSVPYWSTCCGASGYQDVSPDLYLCNPGYNYNYACENDRWKKVVNDCLDKYLQYQDEYKHLTEDTVNCEVLRACTRAYYWCHACHENASDPACPSQRCEDYPQHQDKCPAGKDTFCEPDEVFDSYYTTTNSHPICRPCQHLNWDDQRRFMKRICNGGYENESEFDV